jgi:hypothetical protein
MSLYDQDYYQWTQEQAGLLKIGALSQLDVENLIEEIESMGKSQKKELINRLTVLIAHLLKWDYQPERRGRSWELTIKAQRIQIRRHISENPSLKSMLLNAVILAYEVATLSAAAETGLSESTFPETCPYSVEYLLGEHRHSENSFRKAAGRE